MKEKNILYKCYVIFSALICVFILPYVGSVREKIVPEYDANPGANYLVLEKAHQIALYIWPILIAYVIAFVVLIVRKEGGRKVYYPVTVFTVYVLSIILLTIHFGADMAWYGIGLFYPLVAVLVVTSILGKDLDNHTLNKKSLTKLAGIIAQIAVLFLLINLVAHFGGWVQEMLRGDTTVQTANADHMSETVKQEFDNLLDNQVIFVNSLKVDGELNKITEIELLIETKKAPDSEADFCNMLIKSHRDLKELFEKYHYTDNNLFFVFTEKNPYAEASSVHYQDGGYIRDEGERYFIYLNPSPIIIDK